MKQKIMILIVGLSLFLFAVPSLAATSIGAAAPDKPILIIVADKMDSQDVFQSKLPGFQRLLKESVSGLLSIRSGSGYMKANSGYLTIGAGIRCAVPDEVTGLMAPEQPLAGLTARNVWEWNGYRRDEQRITNYIVPEVGWVFDQAIKKSRDATPGMLGKLFHVNGWKTNLLGNSDQVLINSRPGGLLLMDQAGRVDDGVIDAAINLKDPAFPYGTRIDTAKVFAYLTTHLQSKNLIMVDYSDFARLDNYREEILKPQYRRLKNASLQRFSVFINQILERWSSKDLSLIVVSPTLSNESYVGKRLLAPVMLRAAGYSGGVLSSGTTHWPGIVSNIDLLPTLLKMAGIETTSSLDGRPIEVKSTPNAKAHLLKIHQRINAALAGQRSILDWYLGLITGGWIVGLLGIYFKFGKFSEWLLSGVAVIPLVLIIQPLFPLWSWNVNGFLSLTIGITLLLGMVRSYQNRFLVLTAVTWLVLVIDQLMGWNLIRYSAMGFSPAAGARNYGMGNEFMGAFLPIALVLSYLIQQKTHQSWPTLLILAVTTFVLGVPKLGINFGGTLAALVGFAYYIFQLYHWNLSNRKLWMVVIGGAALVLAVGYWDALRAPEHQTHVGRFFGLIFSSKFTAVLLIMQRKLEMNFKLMGLSPWARIVWLALGMGIVNRIVTKNSMINENQRIVWRGILVAGVAAFAFNDSGIVALATGMAFGFSYLLVAYARMSTESEVTS